jgi:hypothetical protein
MSDAPLELKLGFPGASLVLAHQTRPSLTSSFGRAVTKHFLAGSTSAQPLLRPHRHSSVLTSSAHARAQAPSKCCSGCSPSPYPCSVPDWALTIIGYLPLAHTCRLMNLINSTRCSARTLFGDLRSRKHAISEKRGTVS